MTQNVVLNPDGVRPQFTLADRMRKAREHAHLHQSEIATELGISRQSVGNYEAGRTKPGRPVMLAWAMRTGVSYEWLINGTPELHGPSGPGAAGVATPP